jgi:hypothetical protein
MRVSIPHYARTYSLLCVQGFLHLNSLYSFATPESSIKNRIGDSFTRTDATPLRHHSFGASATCPTRRIFGQVQDVQRAQPLRLFNYLVFQCYSNTKVWTDSFLLKLHLVPDKSQARFRMYKEPNNQALSTPFLGMCPYKQTVLIKESPQSCEFSSPNVNSIRADWSCNVKSFFYFLGRLGKNVEMVPNDVP